MNSDFTQQQSLGGLEKAEQLSLQTTVPPSEVEGYRIEKLLGQGAFGQVWLGHDHNTGRKVAIKFYLHRTGVNWQLINREVKHLVNMSTGRYVVQILSVGWEAEPPFYVMEFLENGSLEDLVRSEGSLSIPLAAKMFREIAEGLSYAHGKGILHCDLKPANVMLDQDCRPRLGDFGQSRMTDEQTPSLGTLFFMAPEQADLEAPPDAAWDVYALGAIAYSMLVGSPPYRTPEIVETLDTAHSLNDRLKRYRETIRRAKTPRLHYRRKGIDKTLCQIIDKCLEPNPKKRFANVQQVIEALDQRTRSRARKPMYLLGILGPLLLLPLMLLFSARSISTAKDETIRELRRTAIERNVFISRVAAKTLESEIAALFRLVEDEANDPRLRSHISALASDAAPILEVLRDGKSHPKERRELFAVDSQAALTSYLSDRLTSIMKDSGSASSALLNTVFVNDAYGTNLGIHFADTADAKNAASPVGKNYAYRSYFTGKRADSDKTLPPSTFAPLRATHLSSAFQSTSTRRWKVGISCPIWADEDPSGSERPIGVIVLTINLGNFKLLPSQNSEQHERFAALVDGRKGNGQGTLLQHPFLNEIEKAAVAEDSNNQFAPPRIDQPSWERLVAEEGVPDFADPCSSLPGGEEYQEPWLAALQPVHLPGKVGDMAEGRNASDLWVLVQEKSSSVATPVEKLGSKLFQETVLEFMVLLGVILTLWFFVFRLLRRSVAAGVTSGDSNFANSSFHSTIDSGM